MYTVKWVLKWNFKLQNRFGIHGFSKKKGILIFGKDDVWLAEMMLPRINKLLTGNNISHSEWSRSDMCFYCQSVWIMQTIKNNGAY